MADTTNTTASTATTAARSQNTSGSTAGKTVIAGPVEATALGNLLVQARTHGVLSGDLWSLRAELRAAVRTRSYEPR